MARYNGLIIPRSYNDYYSRADPHATREIMAAATDAELDETSAAAIQNKAIAQLIPEGATSENRLTTKSYVDNAVQTNSAINRGSFDTYAELIAYTGPVTRNDYATVADDETHDHETWRYKWDDDGGTWTAEYRINESPFTQEQLSAINSGINAEKVEKLDGIEDGAEKNTVNSVNGMTGDVELPGATIDDYFSKTSENPLKNKIITGALFAIYAPTVSGETVTADLPGVNNNDIPVGYAIKLFFPQLVMTQTENSALTLNGKPIKIYKYGILQNMKSHYMGYYYGYVFCSAGTTLELFYNGSAWVIMGNPEVIVDGMENESIRIKADGFIIQFGKLAITGTNNIVYPIPFTLFCNISCVLGANQTSSPGWNRLPYNQTLNGFSINHNAGLTWLAQGY